MVGNLVSNAGCPPASATPPPRVIVDRPDPRLGSEQRQLGVCGCFIVT
jgi:hypothetical protein